MLKAVPPRAPASVRKIELQSIYLLLLTAKGYLILLTPRSEAGSNLGIFTNLQSRLLYLDVRPLPISSDLGLHLFFLEEYSNVHTRKPRTLESLIYLRIH
jgi:hypothetical protein